MEVMGILTAQKLLWEQEPGRCHLCQSCYYHHLRPNRRSNDEDDKLGFQGQRIDVLSRAGVAR